VLSDLWADIAAAYAFAGQYRGASKSE
jgi:hypothetical protein